MAGPVIVERVFNAAPDKVWKALTDNDELKQWYFELPAFNPVVGFEFQFYFRKDEHHQYLHHCRITEVIPLRKLAYSWRYDGYEGNSVVSFELTPEGRGTRIRVIHAGLESFPPIDDFARNNFKEGWTHVVNISLKEYLEKG